MIRCRFVKPSRYWHVRITTDRGDCWQKSTRCKDRDVAEARTGNLLKILSHYDAVKIMRDGELEAENPAEKEADVTNLAQTQTVSAE